MGGGGGEARCPEINGNYQASGSRSRMLHGHHPFWNRLQVAGCATLSLPPPSLLSFASQRERASRLEKNRSNIDDEERRNAKLEGGFFREVAGCYRVFRTFVFVVQIAVRRYHAGRESRGGFRLKIPRRKSFSFDESRGSDSIFTPSRESFSLDWSMKF